MRERAKPIRLRLYRHNGEYVNCMDVDSPTWENAKELVWRYLGDINKRTEIDVSVHDDWNDAQQPGQCVLRMTTIPSRTEYTVRWQQ